MEQTILQVKNLSIDFKTKHGTVRAVDEVNFDIKRGEVDAESLPLPWV